MENTEMYKENKTKHASGILKQWILTEGIFPRVTIWGLYFPKSDTVQSTKLFAFFLELCYAIINKFQTQDKLVTLSLPI